MTLDYINPGLEVARPDGHPGEMRKGNKRDGLYFLKSLSVQLSVLKL